MLALLPAGEGHPVTSGSRGSDWRACCFQGAGCINSVFSGTEGTFLPQ